MSESFHFGETRTNTKSKYNHNKHKKVKTRVTRGPRPLNVNTIREIKENGKNTNTRIQTRDSTQGLAT